MLTWFRNWVATKPVRDPSFTELLTAWLELQAEWRSFLEQQARVTRRAAKRVRDDTQVPPDQGEPPGVTDKQQLRQRAVANGMFRRPRGTE